MARDSEVSERGQGLIEEEPLEQLPAEPEASALERLEGEVAQLREQLSEMNDRYLRAMADFDNYRKRLRQEKDEAIRYGLGSLILDFLPVLDNLGRALEAAKQSPESPAGPLIAGVEITRSQFEQVLARHGVVPIVAVGTDFDPTLHEAVLRIPTDETPEGTVVAEVEKGYTMEGKVLRPSKVGVAVPPEVGETRAAQ